jgi:FkbM family methyltransferase
MKFYDRVHALHRAWRYRLRTERNELRYMLGLRLEPGGSVLDIGANRGIYSYWMHKRFGTARYVVAFEPQPELIEHLGELKVAFGLDRLIVAPVALSSYVGMATLRRPRSHWGGATIDNEADFDDLIDTIPVAVSPLDEYLAQRPELRPARFIKCDVQNHETDVVRGAVNTFKTDRPELLLEWADGDSARRKTLLELLQSLDYRGCRFVQNSLMPEDSARRHGEPQNWENYLFLPAGRTRHAA